MATLEKAIEIATQIHEGQTRFDGSNYINHPLRVMGTVAAQGHSIETQMVAVMHDAVEDSKGQLTIADLEREGFGEEILFPLDLLTKEDGEDYDLYVQRLAVNPRSRAVKKADLFDNMDLTGLENPSRKRIETIEKYGRALLYIARFPQPRI
jgi:(p)ppGpp synthase/HD superfamily hydrolase